MGPTPTDTDPTRRGRAPDLGHLLERTSRTFALTIPRLPEPTRHEVGVAYLLFRIADTFEDATEWAGDRQRAALADFTELLDDPDPERAAELADRWSAEPPVEHGGYVELLAETTGVLAAFQALREPARESIREHVTRTARGMSDFVGRSDEGGELRLETLRDLRDYCYVVAGIVGEMLTDLFLLDRNRLPEVADRLRKWAPSFGEGLQLTNILKDAAVDAGEGRLFLPPSVDRREVFALARRDLALATEYTLALQEAGAEEGLVAFNALPVALARATLDEVERHGPGSKISRARLWAIVEEVESALAEDRPVLEREAPDPVG